MNPILFFCKVIKYALVHLELTCKNLNKSWMLQQGFNRNRLIEIAACLVSFTSAPL
jgi:hypothetical protein